MTLYTTQEKANRYDSLQLAIAMKIESLDAEIKNCNSILERDSKRGMLNQIDAVILGQKTAYESLRKDLEMWV